MVQKFILDTFLNFSLIVCQNFGQYLRALKYYVAASPNLISSRKTFIFLVQGV